MSVLFIHSSFFCCFYVSFIELYTAITIVFQLYTRCSKFYESLHLHTVLSSAPLALALLLRLAGIGTKDEHGCDSL